MMVFDLGGSRFRRDRDRIPDGSPRPRGGGPRLERRNAVRNIDYDADVASSSAAASWSSASTSDSPFLRGTQSLDHSPSYSSQTSFRIAGRVDGEVDLLCRSLGLSGPEEFSIPAAAWAARKSLSSPSPSPRQVPARADVIAGDGDFGNEFRSPESTSGGSPRQDPARADVIAGDGDFGNEFRSPASTSGGDGGIGGAGNKIRSLVGIRGARPPALSPLTPDPAVAPPARSPLAPPPSSSRPEIDSLSSTWDLVRSFAPDGDGGVRRVFESDDDEAEEGEVEELVEEEDVRGGGGGEEVEVRLGETADDHMESCSFSTSNGDDDSSSTTTEAMFVISPNGKFRRIIRSWMRGGLLGSGSFGTVYEGISDDGIFFAVKEVSLIDQGSNARQCILQLEQEIALLSQFEHENIVQYYGTDKEEAKLFIFLELVTQGSLASLYQKYNLQNSQVSAYTRQILNGLKYLHDRNVVHRDIKCANILVHANGSVKLADFGLAKEITKFNMLKSCKGSAYWMAPEVVNSKREYGAAVDIWSLGCTVLEMLTRQVPYPNLEWTQALFRIGRGEKPPIPKSLSVDARDFIGQCVQANPEERPSATQLLDHPFVRRSLPVSVGGSESSSHGID